MAKNENFEKKGLALGVSEFEKVIDCGSYYFDKTLLIKDFLDTNKEVILFTRPRRFGKTLNMTMLRTFFEKPSGGKDTNHYFKDLKIWQAGEKYRAEQGKRPVIYLTFKDIKTQTFEQALSKIGMAVLWELDRHSELFESNKFTDIQKEQLNELKNNLKDYAVLSDSIKTLSMFLFIEYGEKPLILLDEYDVPIQAGYEFGFYKEIVSFMRNLLSGAFKDNPSLYRGVLTGVSRVSKESIFSGLNNIIVNSIFDDDFSEYFGFTQEEVNEMFRFYGIEDKLKEAADWYDGYIFGETHIYNPWSLLSYVSSGCKPNDYWANMSENSLVGAAISKLDEEDLDSLYSLMNGKKTNVIMSEHIIYPELGETLEQAYCLLAQTGYLKVSNSQKDIDYICDVEIPNRELYMVYAREIIRRIIKPKSRTPAKNIIRMIVNGDAAGLQKYLSSFLLETCSSFDLTEEKDYQNLIIGLLASMRRGYSIKGNREAGHGRADIMIKPRLDNEDGKNLPGIIIELKHYAASEAEKDDPEKIKPILEKQAEEALRQIEQKSYISDLHADGVKTIIKFGVSFSGKYAKVISRSC